MLKGYIEATKGLRVSERTLKQMLPAVSQVGHYARQTSSLERSNPAIYSARYFGHKMHLDQNEKLIHFGVTYVMARDGRLLVVLLCPVKIIWSSMMKCLELLYWSLVCGTLCIDHGKEFYLTLYVQEKLRVGRGDRAVAPYVQTTLTSNHVLERLWVELNHRVTYPIKRIVAAMSD